MAIYWRGPHKFGWGKIITLPLSTETKIYVSPLGDDTNGTGMQGSPYATVTKAMTMVTTTRKIIICAPGTYTEDVTWSDVNGAMLLSEIPGTVTVEAATAFAIKIDPAAASGTWSATISVGLSHGDGLKGLWVNNTNVAKRMNIYLNDVDIESQTSTDVAIDVDRAGTSAHAIRMYVKGRENTIEGLVDFITESTDDRLRFFGMRLIGGVTVTGSIVMEVAFKCCGILTSGESYGTGNVSGHFACWNETDANPNVYTVVADDDETSH